jgi:mannose-1-phosphate guanylyltransferase
LKALLLAAGFGTRLKPITDTVPKCLVPIHGKPLLGYWLDLLLANGMDQILINTHYLPKQVHHFLHGHPLKDKVSLVHEETLLGTGGTVLHNRAWLGDSPFLLAHADNLTRFNVRAFIEAHERRLKGVEITMMIFETDAPKSCGIVVYNDQGIITEFHEKVSNPPGNHANAAVYIIEPSVIRFLESLNKEMIDFSNDVLPQYLNRMQIFHNADYHRDIGTPESLRLAECEYENDPVII